MEELDNFLKYAAVFLGNIGNYFGHGDQKFVPNVSVSFLRRLAAASEKTETLFKTFENAIVGTLPGSLGYPSNTAQIAYYIGEQHMSKEEHSNLQRVLEADHIEPENTRIRKVTSAQGTSYDILVASTEHDQTANSLALAQ